MQTHLYIDAPHELEELVIGALTRSLQLPRRSIDVQFSGDSVTLQGTLASCYQKQLAQEAVLAVEGVTGVHNEIEVIY